MTATSSNAVSMPVRRAFAYAGPSEYTARHVAEVWAARGYRVRCYPGAATSWWWVDVEVP